MAYLGLLAVALVGVLGARASPALYARQSITTLTTTQITSYLPFAYFASAGYCSPSSTLTWTCGSNCEAAVVSDFKPVGSGGSSSVQNWFVGYSPSLQSVIVSHQGTSSSKIISILSDTDFFLTNLDTTLFPGLSSSIEVHSGFADEQAKSATAVLAAVQTALSTFSATEVTVVGHSLGAAISLIDLVYLSLQLPSVTVKHVGYGQPRVGNQAWANYLDAHFSVTHINNKEDLVPILPGMFLGYHHPSGEIHIEDSGAWDACPGQDNESDLCSTGDVSNIFEGDVSEHDGPYDGVTMGC